MDDYDNIVEESEVVLPDSFPGPAELAFENEEALMSQLMKLYAVVCTPGTDLLMVGHGLEALIVVDDIVAEQPCPVVADWCKRKQAEFGEAHVLAGIWSHLGVSDASDNPSLALEVHMWIGTRPNHLRTKEIPL